MPEKLRRDLQRGVVISSTATMTEAMNLSYRMQCYRAGAEEETPEQLSPWLASPRAGMMTAYENDHRQHL